MPREGIRQRAPDLPGAARDAALTTTSVSRHRLDLVPPNPRDAALGFVATLALGIVLLIAASSLVALAAGDGVMPRVSIGGVAVGGLTRAEAEERLTAELPSLSSGAALVRIGAETLTVPYARIGRGYEMDSMLDAALGVGRDPNPFAAGVARLRSLLRGTELPVAVHPYDPGAIEEVLAEAADRVERAPISATAGLSGDRFAASASRDGLRLDLPVLRAQLEAAVARPTPADVEIVAPTRAAAPSGTTEEAQRAAEAANRIIGAPLQLTTDPAGKEKPLELTPEQLRGLVRFGVGETGYAPQLDEAAARDAFTAFAKGLARTAKDATFVFGSSGVTGVRPAVAGRALDVDASLQALATEFSTRAGGGSASEVPLAFTQTQPALTTEAAQAAVPKMRRISTWTTHYVPGVSNYWGANISIPARDIDGKVLGPGEWFDFWKAIGPVTTARGYGQGGAIINGKSEPTGALAGGICSTSTTIFNAALRAGLQMGERRNHYYYINRYPLGLDATVFQTDSYTLTMTFQNDTPDPIVIRSYTGYGFVRFDLWGVPTGRSVTLTRPIVSNVRHARDLVETSSSVAAGTRVRIETPHDGMNVSVTRYVRDRAGKVIHTDTFLSAYSTVDGRTLVGPTPKPRPSASTTPTPAPTPSAAP
jgi:vancomycin resistance protein YoaR